MSKENIGSESLSKFKKKLYQRLTRVGGIASIGIKKEIVGKLLR